MAWFCCINRRLKRSVQLKATGKKHSSYLVGRKLVVQKNNWRTRILGLTKRMYRTLMKSMLAKSTFHYTLWSPAVNSLAEEAMQINIITLIALSYLGIKIIRTIRSHTPEHVLNTWVVLRVKCFLSSLYSIYLFPLFISHLSPQRGARVASIVLSPILTTAL